ncbi:DUF1707 domain-containing protein [Dactylosporangium sp. NPDC049525]|uniref:DUF1707 SHOCT-like domain-containing protein n=1 Tax=Dactylosporangium sp. NPDC049525 TaxID=3154730 RepID=UPI003432C182
MRDRQRVIEALQHHTQVGRLTLDEFADRCDTVLAAKTLDDLRAATHDLPALPSEAAATATGPGKGRRQQPPRAAGVRDRPGRGHPARPRLRRVPLTARAGRPALDREGRGRQAVGWRSVPCQERQRAA